MPKDFPTKALKEKYLYIGTPLNTVFISGIPLPSASGDIKYPTLVAPSMNITEVITQTI